MMRPATAAAAAIAGPTRWVRTPGTLAVLEIAVGGRHAALARLAAIAIAAGAHRAAGFAPEETGVAEDAVEPGGFGLALHRARARNHQGDDARGDAPSPRHRRGGDEIGQARIGAGADEDAVDRQPRYRRSRREAHIVERAPHRWALVGGRAVRVGHAAGDGDGLARIGAPGDLRLQVLAIDGDLALELRIGIAHEVLPGGERLVPQSSLRRPRAPRDPGKRRVVRGDETRARAHLDGEIAQRQPALDRHRPRRCAGIFNRVPACAVEPDLGDDPQRHVLGTDLVGEPAIEPDAHALRPPAREHLGGEHVLELGGADPEGERTEAADGAGMAVGNRVGRARQDHAELGRDDVGDALLGIAEIEDADAVAAASFAHRPQEWGAVGVRGVVAAGLGRDGVVLHREGQIGTSNAAVGLGELLEGMGSVKLMEHVPVDIDEVAAVAAAGDEMRIPDLVEQGWHERGPVWRAGRTPTPQRPQVKLRLGV